MYHVLGVEPDRSWVLTIGEKLTKAQALRELRTRVNEGCCYSLDEPDVRVRRAT